MKRISSIVKQTDEKFNLVPRLPGALFQFCSYNKYYQESVPLELATATPFMGSKPRRTATFVQAPTVVFSSPTVPNATAGVLQTGRGNARARGLPAWLPTTRTPKATSSAVTAYLVFTTGHPQMSAPRDIFDAAAPATRRSDPCRGLLVRLPAASTFDTVLPHAATLPEDGRCGAPRQKSLPARHLTPGSHSCGSMHRRVPRTTPVRPATGLPLCSALRRYQSSIGNHPVQDRKPYPFVQFS